MSGSYHGMAPAPYAVVVERKSSAKVRAQRKTFSGTTVVALSLIGIAALCHKLTYRGYYQDLADAPAPAGGGIDATAVKAIEGDMAHEEKKIQTGFKENWVSPRHDPVLSGVGVRGGGRGGGGEGGAAAHQPHSGLLCGAWPVQKMRVDPRCHPAMRRLPMELHFCCPPRRRACLIAAPSLSRLAQVAATIKAATAAAGATLADDGVTRRWG